MSQPTLGAMPESLPPLEHGLPLGLFLVERREPELLSTDTADNEQRRNGIKDSAEQKVKQLGDTPH